MTPRCQWHCGVNDTAEFFCIREYLREIVTICENTVLQHINKGRRWIIILNYKGGKNFTRDSVPLITISSRKEIQKSCDTVPWIAIYRQTDPVKICTKLLASCLINRQALRSCHLFWNFLLQNSLSNKIQIHLVERIWLLSSSSHLIDNLLQPNSYQRSFCSIQYTVERFLGYMAISQHWQRNIYFKTYQVHV